MNVLWAVASLKLDNKGLVEKVSAAILESVPLLSGQDCALALWALAKLDSYSPRVFSSLVHHMSTPHVLPTLTHQNVANMLWACALAGHGDDISKEAVRRVLDATVLPDLEWSILNVSIAVAASSELRVNHQGLVKQAVDLLHSQPGKFTAHQLTKTLSGLPEHVRNAAL